GRQLGSKCGGGARLHGFPVNQARPARAPRPRLERCWRSDRLLLRGRESCTPRLRPAPTLPLCAAS
ncbi:hypothetical protein P7K49_003421, partial [Saguinus oedipus]